MTPDIEKFRPYVDQFDLSEEEKIELIHTVWSIMESFVDMAFGIHPVQQVQRDGAAHNLQCGRAVLDSDPEAENNKDCVQ